MTTRPTRHHGRFRLLALLAAGTLVVAACAEDEGDDSTDATEESTESTTEESGPSAEEVLGEPNPATGEPVALGLISSAEATDSVLSANWQNVEQGMTMAVEYANEYLGGIGGRPIDLVICQGGVEPAGWQDCANQMVNDEVAAVIQPFNSFGSAVVPIMTGAGIPYVVLSAASVEELTAVGAFSLTGGLPATLGGIALHAEQNGYASFAMVGIDVPALTQAVDFLGAPVFEEVGVGFEFLTAPPGVPDMTPQLQAAVDGGAASIGLIGDQTFCASFLQAYDTLALEIPDYLVSTCIDPATIETYGEQMDGSWMVGISESDPESEDVILYGAMAEVYGNGLDPDPAANTGAATGATVLLTFVAQMQDLTGDITAPTVLAQIQTAQDTPLFLGGGSTLTCNGTAVPIFANVCSAYMLIGTVTAEGQLVDAELFDTAPLFAA